MNLKYFFKKPLQIPIALLSRFHYFSFIRKTAAANDHIKFSYWFNQKVLGINKEAYWPMHTSSKVVGANNIYAGIDTNPGLNPGCYIQGTGKLYIGDYSRIGPNCGLMSGNHDIYDHQQYVKKETIIGKYCWIGMNSIILPGVKLGDFTKVAAGSVVTKSFPNGYCIIGGNPAKVIKELEPEKCIRYKNPFEYNGYIPSSEFEAYRAKHLNV